MKVCTITSDYMSTVFAAELRYGMLFLTLTLSQGIATIKSKLTKNNKIVICSLVIRILGPQHRLVVLQVFLFYLPCFSVSPLLQ